MSNGSRVHAKLGGVDHRRTKTHLQNHPDSGPNIRPHIERRRFFRVFDLIPRFVSALKITPPRASHDDFANEDDASTIAHVAKSNAESESIDLLVGHSGIPTSAPGTRPWAVDSQRPTLESLYPWLAPTTRVIS